MNNAENNTKSLIDQLKIETVELKNAYIARTKEFTNAEYNRIVERKNWSAKEWCELLGLEPLKNANGKYSFPKNFFNTSDSRKHFKLEAEAFRVASKTQAQHLEVAISDAEKHFAGSIEKLALRVIKKGLNLGSFKMQSTYLDPNMSTVITDGKITVRAYTIIAGGPIQKPHYRYLVK